MNSNLTITKNPSFANSKMKLKIRSKALASTCLTWALAIYAYAYHAQLDSCGSAALVPPFSIAAVKLRVNMNVNNNSRGHGHGGAHGVSRRAGGARTRARR